MIPRDIDVATILIGRSGRPYLVDFELACFGRAAHAAYVAHSEQHLARRLALTGEAFG